MTAGRSERPAGIVEPALLSRGGADAFSSATQRVTRRLERRAGIVKPAVLKASLSQKRQGVMLDVLHRGSPDPEPMASREAAPIGSPPCTAAAAVHGDETGASSKPVKT